MCYLERTRYACSHLAPFHPPAYKRPTAAEDATQGDPTLECPTHKDTKLHGCQDSGRRGSWCDIRLEDMEDVEREGEGVCDECEEGEWVIVGEHDDS